MFSYNSCAIVSSGLYGLYAVCMVCMLPVLLVSNMLLTV